MKYTGGNWGAQGNGPTLRDWLTYYWWKLIGAHWTIWRIRHAYRNQ